MQSNENSIDLVYDIAREALVSQQTQKSTLEAKASTLVAFAGGMFALLMGAIETLRKIRTESQVLVIVGVALFAISVILCTFVNWIRVYRLDPEPAVFAKEYVNRPSTETRLQLISNLTGAWTANQTVIERNAVVLQRAFVTQAIAFIVVGIALVLAIL